MTIVGAAVGRGVGGSGETKQQPFATLTDTLANPTSFTLSCGGDETHDNHEYDRAAPHIEGFVQQHRRHTLSSKPYELTRIGNAACSAATPFDHSNRLRVMHCTACSAAPSFRAVVRCAACVLRFFLSHTAAVDRHHSHALTHGHSHAMSLVVRTDRSDANDALGNDGVERLRISCHEDPP